MQPRQPQPPVDHPDYPQPDRSQASVVDSYRRLQSYIIGALLIIVGALSIVFGIVETVIISQHYFGGAGYTLICGAMVSVVLVQSTLYV